jgi:hypothetical protein
MHLEHTRLDEQVTLRTWPIAARTVVNNPRHFEQWLGFQTAKAILFGDLGVTGAIAHMNAGDNKRHKPSEQTINQNWHFVKFWRILFVHVN